MRQKRGQPEMARCTLSVANPNASAGTSSMMTTATSTGVTFDILDILSGRPVTARITAVTPAICRWPPLRNRNFYCAGRTTANCSSVWCAFASRSAFDGYSSLPLVFPATQTVDRK